MTGNMWLDLLIPVVTALAGALAARYGIKLPPAPQVPPTLPLPQSEATFNGTETTVHAALASVTGLTPCMVGVQHLPKDDSWHLVAASLTGAGAPDSVPVTASQAQDIKRLLRQVRGQ